MSNTTTTLTDESRRAHRSDLGLGELTISLAIIGGVVYAIAGLPRIPTGSPAMPRDLELQLQLLVRSPTPEQLDAAVLLLSWAFWLAWAFVVATTVLRIAVVLAMQLTAGAAWVYSLRWLSDLLTLPFVRRAVDGSMAGTLFLRVAIATPSAPVAMAAPTVAHVNGIDDRDAQTSEAMSTLAPAAHQVPPDLQPGDVVHIVRYGETLTSISEDHFGDPEHWKQIYADNRHRPQPHHGSLQDAGKIYPGWVLIIRGPTRMVEFDADGNAWHTVRQGETFWGITRAVYGDGGLWPEIFASNVGLEYNGYVLGNPNVIQPGMRLRLEKLDIQPPAPAVPAEPEPAPVTEPREYIAETPAAAPDPPPAEPAPAPDIEQAPPIVPTAEVAVEQEPPPPAADAQTDSRPPLSPEQAGLAAGGVAAVALAAGHLVVRRRRPAPIRTEPESDVHIEDGFAEADPVHDLARRLAHTDDPATVIAGMLGQAYAAVFDEVLQGTRREEPPVE